MVTQNLAKGQTRDPYIFEAAFLYIQIRGHHWSRIGNHYAEFIGHVTFDQSLIKTW